MADDEEASAPVELTLPDEERFNYVLFIGGRKGSGKTYLAKEIAEGEDRCVSIDNLGQFDNMEVCTGYEACARALVKAEKRKKFKLALRTNSVEEDIRLMGLVFLMQKVTLICDETSKYVSPSFMPEEIEQLVRYGRHQAINQVYMARRPAEINRELTAQADVIVTFRQHEPRDVKYLSDFMGPEAKQSKNLGNYKVMVWGDEEKAPLAVLERANEPGSVWIKDEPHPEADTD